MRAVDAALRFLDTERRPFANELHWLLRPNGTHPQVGVLLAVASTTAALVQPNSLLTIMQVVQWVQRGALGSITERQAKAKLLWQDLPAVMATGAVDGEIPNAEDLRDLRERFLDRLDEHVREVAEQA